MVSVSSRPESHIRRRAGDKAVSPPKERARRGKNLEIIVSSWAQQRASLPVAVVLSIFDDLLHDLDGVELDRASLAEPLGLADVHVDEHGVASLRGRASDVRVIARLLAEVLGATGEASIPLAALGLLRVAEEAAPPMDAAWFRAQLRSTLGPPGTRAELRALMDQVEAAREFASLIPAEALLDSTRPAEGLAHATFIDPTRPESDEASLLDVPSAPIEPALAPTTFDLPPVHSTVDVAPAPESEDLEAWAAPVPEPEPLDDDAPTERPSPASARPGAANWADSIASNPPTQSPSEPSSLDALPCDPPTELVLARAPLGSEEPAAAPRESEFQVEAQTAFPSDPVVRSYDSRSDDARPVVRHEPARPRPVSLTYAPAARLRNSTPAEETPSRIRIPAEERGRAWAILVFSLVIGLVAAWALGYLP